MENKKHIVILSYLFPPHSNVGGRRQYFFAKYLAELGYKITVITADLPLKENWTWETDLSFASIIKLPKNSKPKEYSSGQQFFNSLYKSLDSKNNSLLKRIAWKIGEFFLPINFNIRLDFNEKELVKKLHKIDYIIATGGPWLMFEYGNRLKKASKAKLILDYRDPWNAINQDVYLDSLNNKGIFSYFLDKKHSISEQRSIKNSDLVISVSEPISQNCDKLLNSKKTKTIYNGFDYSENIIKKEKKSKTFNITFSGHLRAEQNLDIFIKGVELALAKMPELNNLLKINFIGTKVSRQKVVDSLYHSKANSIFNITPFIPKKEAMSYLLTSNLLLQISYKNKKGIVSSKLIQYLGINKPIILVSNNNDIMEKIIAETESGIIAKSPESLSDIIIKSVALWQANQSFPFSPNKEKVNFYSFKNQVSVFEKMLKTL